jgi:hypothetical protein
MNNYLNNIKKNKEVYFKSRLKYYQLALFY